MDQPQPILSVRNLSTCFRTDRGTVTAVDDVSFDVYPGETIGIVGESGCGKTVTSKSIMRLLPERNSFIKPESRIWFTETASKAVTVPGGPAVPAGSGNQTNSNPHVKPASNSPSELHQAPTNGVDLAHCDERTMRTIRGDKIAMIFQEPMTSLNPVFRVGWQIDEALKYHTKLSKTERRDHVLKMLKLVEIPNPEKRIDEYPHQLSGGMRQRVMIAIALCCEPSILIADEPTTALDVTIQAQILDLMDGLKRKLNTATMLITHNLGVVAQVCDRVIVMYAGRVIESGTVRDIFHRPQHPYTKALLESIPRAGNKTAGKRMPTIEGIVPSLFDLPKGCRFQDRCKYKQQRCIDQEPALEPAPITGGQLVRCHFPLGDPVHLTASAGAAR